MAVRGWPLRGRDGRVQPQLRGQPASFFPRAAQRTRSPLLQRHEFPFVAPFVVAPRWRGRRILDPLAHQRDGSLRPPNAVPRDELRPRRDWRGRRIGRTCGAVPIGDHGHHAQDGRPWHPESVLGSVAGENIHSIYSQVFFLSPGF